MISIHNITSVTAKAAQIEGGNWIDLTFAGAYSTDVPTTITLYFHDPELDQLEALVGAINRNQAKAEPVTLDEHESINDEVPF